MNKKIKIEIAVGIIAVVAIVVGVAVWKENREIKFEGQKVVVSENVSQDNILPARDEKPVQKATNDNQVNLTIPENKNEWKEFSASSSFGSLHFKYPANDCSLDDNGSEKCNKLVVIDGAENISIGSIVTRDKSDVVSSMWPIYYGRYVYDKKTLNSFLHSTLGSLCSYEDAYGHEGSSKIFENKTPVRFFLGAGCSINGKVGGYYSPSTNEAVVFGGAYGGGCSFSDCDIEGKIMNTIELGNTQLLYLN